MHAAGFPVDGIVDRNDNVVVDGDIVLSKCEHLAIGCASAGAPHGPVFQYMTQWGVGGLASSVTVNLSELNGVAGWDTAARQAIQEWSSIAGVAVRMREVAGPADITLHMTSSSGTCGSTSAIACAQFPTSNGKPGSSINIWTNFNGLSASQKLWTLAHELGHTIGFRHTDLISNGESTSGSYKVFGTPDTDNASIMNHAIGYTWPGFSYYDVAAAYNRYPLDEGPFVAQWDAPSHTVSWVPQPGATGYALYYNHYREECYPEDGYCAGVYDNISLGTTTSTSMDLTSSAPCNDADNVVVRALLSNGASPHSNVVSVSCE